MLERVEEGVTWTQTYNAENRLASVSDGEDTWSFTYDGDGRRVRQVGPDGEVTLYLGGGAYEVRDAAGDQEVVKYYGIAGQRVALSGRDGMQYLLTDHLGSVSAVLDAAGNLLAEQRYTPFGEVRFDVTLGTTDFGYTGQRLLSDTGLMDYNARFYAPGLGRWTQPDMIVPGAGNPQNFGRFTYVLNGPLNLIDPTGNAGTCPVPLLDNERCIYNPSPNLGGSENGGSGGESGGVPNANDTSASQNGKELEELSLADCIERPFGRNCLAAYTLGGWCKYRYDDFYVCRHGQEDRTPDYFVLNLGGSIPVLGLFGGAQLSITLDRYGNLYVAPGAQGGPDAYAGVSISLTAGWVGDSRLLSQAANVGSAMGERQMEQFLVAGYTGISACFLVCTGGTSSPLNPFYGFEIGVGTPQLSYGGSYSFLLGNWNNSGVPLWRP